jgi:hypothetical protein
LPAFFPTPGAPHNAQFNLSSGPPKETHSHPRVCTFADTARAAWFLSTSCAPSITFYFPATCSRFAGMRFTGLCAGAWTLSGISQSRSDHSCNPPSSPTPPVQILAFIPFFALHLSQPPAIHPSSVAPTNQAPSPNKKALSS